MTHDEAAPAGTSRRFTLADALTLGNAVAGFLAIVTFTIETGILPGYSDVEVASVFIGLGLVLDSLDGVAARRFGGSSLGSDLDTLADLVTFVVAPAVFVLQAYGGDTWLGSVFTAVLLLLFGTYRLARYNQGEGEGENHTFRGLPTPWAAVSIVILILLQVPYQAALPLMVLLALLMVSHVAYPKSHRRATYATLATAGTASAILLGLLFVPGLHRQLLFVALVIAVFAVAGAPFLLVPRDRGEERGAPEPEDG